MGNTYRPRWPMALAISVPRGLLAGVAGALIALLAGLLLGAETPLKEAVVLGPLMLVIGVAGAVSPVRGRRLTVTEDGLALTREGCEITVRWHDLDQVRKRRFGLVLLEELVFGEGHVRAIEDGAAFASRRADRFRRSGADRRIQPGLYVSDWRNSPVGEACPAC